MTQQLAEIHRPPDAARAEVRDEDLSYLAELHPLLVPWLEELQEARDR